MRGRSLARVGRGLLCDLTQPDELDDDGESMKTVAERIEALLNGAGVAYQCLEHAPVFTSEEAAAARGVPLHIGGKSLVMKIGKRFCLLVVSGARKTQGRMIRRHLKAPRLRFATRDELTELTGLEPGCVPPFGHPIFDLPLYLDSSIAQNERIAFSAGDHRRSMILAVGDYLSVAGPEDIFDFSVAREA